MTPGRKLQVTVTVPEGFSKLLVVEGLTVNGTPVPTCSGCGVRVEEGARFCEVCRLEEPQQDKVPPGRPRCPLGSAPARLLRLLGARLAALGSSAPPRKRPNHSPPSHCCWGSSQHLQSRRSRRL